MATRTILCFILGFFLSTELLLAGATGKIAGKVVEGKTNEPIPFASVVVAGSSLGASTDVEGRYVILNVPPGTYTVAVSLIGYQGARAVNVGVSVDYTTTLDFSLKESTVELNEVIVQGERSPLIRQDQTNPVAAISSEEMQVLPLNDLSQVIGLQAGIVVDDDGDIHVRGGRNDEIAYTLNGLSVNNPYNNLSSIGVAPNALQEVSVSTGTFSAEYGNALSGVVNYVTREGGAKYTGSLRAFSGDYISNRSDVFPYIQRVDVFNQYRIEGTLGGPAPGMDNALSFYASGVYENNRGNLYGERLFNPTDFLVSRDQFSWAAKKDVNGKVVYVTEVDINGKTIKSDSSYIDPRLGASTAPYYFNPLTKSRFDTLGHPTGDGGVVPLNTTDSYNLHANVSYRISPTAKIKYEVVADHGHSFSTLYDSYRYNPDGRPQNWSKGIIHSIDFTHTISNALFYTAKGSYNKSEDKTYAFESINDPRYLPAFYQTTFPGTTFLSGGTYLGRTTAMTETYSGKFDLVAEIMDVHEVKFGAELRLHKVNLEDYTLQFVAANDPTKVIKSFLDVYRDSLQYVPSIPDVTEGYTSYKRKPTQFSAYVQDKLEIAKSLILNAGLRYEYFDPNAKYNPDVSSELSAQDTTFLKKGLTKASIKQSLSPRVSIAYPITDQGVIRFSYGHFYQIADLSALYRNPLYRATLGTRPIFGNSDVKPQRSVQYEMGLQQGLTPDLRLEVVGFYKDVRDYIFTQIVITAKGDLSYELLTNLSYANSKGVTISLLQRRAPGSLFSAALDYTFAVSEGSRTEPREDFFYSEKSGKSVETFLVPLAFDRSHTLNLTLSLTKSDDWAVSTITRLRTGTPYTPSLPASLSLQQTQFIQNSATKPMQWSTDLKAEKFFNLGGVRYSLFAQVDNLFDIENQLSVYANSGLALYNANQVADPHAFDNIRTRIARNDPGILPQSAIDDYYKDPTNINKPRLVRIGFTMYF